MICPKCGVLNVDGTHFCTKCGTVLTVVESQDPSTRTFASAKERYEILVELKNLPVGQIFLARDRVSGKEVLFKRYVPHPSRQTQLDILLRKAVEIQGLNHRNVVAIYFIGHDEEGPYVVTENVPRGQTLHKVLSEKQYLPFDQVVDIARGVASALTFAHKKGLYHGGLTPHSIILTPEMEPKITDFCLGFDEDDPAREYYLAPEQKEKGIFLDFRVDIYALGAIIYKMSTGRDPNPIISSELPTKLQKIVEKATEHQRENRFSSMEDFFSALKHIDDDDSLLVSNTCPLCGSYNERGNRFCANCGAGLVEECPNCKHENALGQKRCANCGIDFSVYKTVQTKVLNARNLFLQGQIEKALEETQAALAIDEQNEEILDLKSQYEEKLRELEQESAIAEALLREGVFKAALDKLAPLAEKYSGSRKVEQIFKKLVEELHRMQYDFSLSEVFELIQKREYSKVVEVLEEAIRSGPAPSQTFAAQAPAGTGTGTTPSRTFDTAPTSTGRENFGTGTQSSDWESGTGTMTWQRFDLDEFEELDSMDKKRKLRKLLAKAKKYFRRGEFGQAAKILRQILREDRRFGNAKGLLRKALQRGKNLKRLARKARDFEDFGEWKKALALWKKALSLAPENRGIREKISRLRERIQEEDFDLEDYLDDEFDFLEEDLEDRDFETDEFLSVEEDWEEDLDFWEEEEEDDRVVSLLKKAQQALKNSEFGEAYRLSKAVLELDWKNEKAKRIQSIAREKGNRLKELIEEAREAEQTGSWEKAASLWREAYYLAPTNATVAQKYEQVRRQVESAKQIPELIEEAKRYLDQLEYRDALILAQDVLAQDSSHPQAMEIAQEAQRKMEEVHKLLLEGRKLLVEKQFQEAIETLEEAVAIYPSHREAKELLSLAKEKWEAGETQFNTIDMEILLGTNPLPMAPPASRSVDTMSWEDDDDDFVSIGRRREDSSFVSRPSAHPQASSGTGTRSSTAETASAFAGTSAQDVDDESFYAQISALTTGDDRGRGQSGGIQSPPPSDSSAIYVGDEFSSLRRQREQELKDDQTNTFPSQQEADPLLALLSGAPTEASSEVKDKERVPSSSPSSSAPTQSTESLVDLDPEDLATEKLPSSSASEESSLPPEMANLLDNIFSEKTDSREEAEEETKPKVVSLGLDPSEQSSEDEVSSLIERVESQVGSSIETPEENYTVTAVAGWNEEDSLRQAVNKALEEIDQADFSDTDKLPAVDAPSSVASQPTEAVPSPTVSAPASSSIITSEDKPLQPAEEDDSIPLTMLGSTSEIHRPLATSQLADNYTTGEIHAMFEALDSSQEEARATADEGEASTPSAALDSLSREETERIAPPLTDTQNVLDAIFSEGDSASISESSPEDTSVPPAPLFGDEQFERLEESQTDKLPVQEAPASGGTRQIPLMETMAYSANDIGLPAGLGSDTGQGLPTSPESEAASAPEESDESFFQVLEQALQEEPEAQGTSAETGTEASGTSVSQTPPPASSGTGATEEIDSFLLDYQATSELTPMDLREAKLREERRQTEAQQMAPTSAAPPPPAAPSPPPSAGSSILDDLDMGLGFDTDSPSQMSQEAANVVHELFGVAPEVSTEPKPPSRFVKLLVKGTIALLLLVLLAAGGIYAWLHHNYQQGLHLLKQGKYKAAFEKFQLVEYPPFVALVGVKNFRKAMKEVCIGLGKQSLEKGEIEKAKMYFQRAQNYTSHPAELKPYLQRVKLYALLQRGDEMAREKNWQKAIQEAYRKAYEFARTEREKKLVAEKIEQAKLAWLRDVESMPKNTQVAIKNRIRELQLMLQIFPKDPEVKKAIRHNQYLYYHLLYLKSLESATFSLTKTYEYVWKAIQFMPEKKSELLGHFVRLLDQSAREAAQAGAYEEAVEKWEFLKNHAKELQISAAEMEKKIRNVRYRHLLSLGQKAKKKGQWAKMIECFCKALRYGPDNLKIQKDLRMGKQKLLRRAKELELDSNWKEARKIYQLLAKYFGQDPEVTKGLKRSSFEYYKELGDVYFQDIEWGKAYEAYEKARKLRPKDAYVLKQLQTIRQNKRLYQRYRQLLREANRYMRDKLWKQAYETLLEIKKLMGLFAQKARKLHQMLQLSKKKWQEESDKNYLYYFNLGLKHLKGKNPYLAYRDFERALYYKPRDIEASRYLAFSRSLKNMVYVPAGYFLMGLPKEKAGPDLDQTPQNRIYLGDFYIDKYEVTNQQYRRFLKAIRRSKDHSKCYPSEPLHKDHTPAYWDDPEFNQENQPVVGVDWYDAYAYARFVGKQLPTEEQWEKAARGTDGRLWPWGNEWNDDALNHYTTGPKKPRVVGSYPLGKSPYGCYDMAGNVWEWTGSEYRPYRNSLFKVPRKKRKHYVLRGGSWNDYEIFLADRRLTWTTFRYPVKPTKRGTHIGFRCVKLPLVIK